MRLPAGTPSLCRGASSPGGSRSYSSSQPSTSTKKAVASSMLGTVMPMWSTPRSPGSVVPSPVVVGDSSTSNSLRFCFHRAYYHRDVTAGLQAGRALYSRELCTCALLRISPTHSGEQDPEPVRAKGVVPSLASACRMLYNSVCSYAASSGPSLNPNLFLEPELVHFC